MSYAGQAPPLTSKETELMLKENHVARICTHNIDGTTHAVPVAYSYVNGQILINSPIRSRKTRNIERNNDVTVLIDTLNPSRGVLIYGTAEIDHHNIYEQTLTINEMRKEYISLPREKLERATKAYVDMWKFVILKITLKHIVTFDYAKDAAWNNFLKTYF